MLNTIFIDLLCKHEAMLTAVLAMPKICSQSIAAKQGWLSWTRDTGSDRLLPDATFKICSTDKTEKGIKQLEQLMCKHRHSRKLLSNARKD